MKALHGYRYKSSVASPSSGGGAASMGTGRDDSADWADVAEISTTINDIVGGWRCKYCLLMEPPNGIPNGHPTKGFFSTRKDNFRNHIKRIHRALRRDSESMDDFFRR